MSDNGEVKITRDEDGKVVVTAKMDSHADASAFAREMARKRRATLTGIDKMIALDQDLSPKVREASVTLVRVLGVAFATILGAVIAITSGHAAVYIFPDAPMPDWLLYALGALTVVGGVWAADEYMKVKRDGVDDNDQRFRLNVFAAIALACLAFDILGVVTTRVASSSGSLVELQDTRAKAQTLRTQIKLAEQELIFLQPPAIPSDAYTTKIDAAMTEPTRTGKPVQTVGELMKICDEFVKDYCHEYQGKFSQIKYLQSEKIAAIAAEKKGPELRQTIRDLQAELDGLTLTNPNVVDEFFAQGESPQEIEANTKKVRFWRTIAISLGQVLIFAIIVLILLDDRHDRIARRRQLKQAKSESV